MASYRGVTPEAGTTLWQYTAGAKVSGIRGPVDMSRLLADPTTFATLADGVTLTPWPATAPGAPVAVTTTPAVNAATVRWLPPDAGSSGISGYTASIAPADASAAPQVRSVGPGTTAATFTGLTNAVPYVVTVQARNAVGAGTVAAPTAVVVPQNPTALAAAGPSAIAYGATATLQGVLTRTDLAAPIAGVPVTVATRPAGASRWTTLATLTTDATGTVTQTVAPAVNSEVRFSYAGDVGVQPASVVRSVVVRRLVSASLSSTTTRVGHGVVLVGRGTPNLAHARVICQQYAGGSWHAVQRALTGRYGWYHFTLTPTSAGSSAYRVVIGAASGVGYGVSPSVTLNAA
jgi:hypothetical protein